MNFGLNFDFRVPLPKVHEAQTLDKFRPIILSYFMFKIITQIIAHRFLVIISRIIFPQQFGFIKSRDISDCIASASECVKLLDRKTFGGQVALKIDIC